MTYTLYSFLTLPAVVESGQPDIAFSAWTETDTGGTDDLCVIEQFVEEFPGAHPVGCLYPQVGSILSTEHLQSGTSQSLFHQSGVLHIIINHCLHLFLALRGIHGFGSTL